METLKQTKKITLSTLKSFAKRNKDKIYSKCKSSFNGMTDGVESVNGKWEKSTITEPNERQYYKTGISGIYTVGSSRDYFTIYEDATMFGIEVYNSCGTTILAIEK